MIPLEDALTLWRKLPEEERIAELAFAEFFHGVLPSPYEIITSEDEDDE